LVFAAHAVLGCGVHHVCLHGSTIAEGIDHQCSHHDAVPGPCGQSQAPADDGPCPLDRCQHMSCSFVKADTVRIDHGERSGSLVGAPLQAVYTFAAQRRLADCEPACPAILSAAQLYVWHCALLI
jgi:hypothetical protein